MGSKKKRHLNSQNQSDGSETADSTEESEEEKEEEKQEQSNVIHDDSSSLPESNVDLSTNIDKRDQAVPAVAEEKSSENPKSDEKNVEESTKIPDSGPTLDDKSLDTTKSEKPAESSVIPESQVTLTFPELTTSKKTLEKKKEIVSRNLLRLYHFLNEDRPFKEESLIQELEMGTPNAELRLNVENLNIELENLLQENQALRESALQTQLEYSEQIEQVEIENRTLKQKINDIDKRIAIELQTRAEKYQEIINQLRAQLKETMSKNEKITEVSGALTSMQERIAILFEQNEQFAKENEVLTTKTAELEQENKTMKEEIQKLEKKNEELRQKEKLQQMVIDGYKRGSV